MSWIKSKQVYYWGDLDCHGLAIRSQVRSAIPNIIPIAMDFATLNKFHPWSVKPDIAQPLPPKRLTTEEHRLFEYHLGKNIRLEQERIAHSYILELLNEFKFQLITIN